MAAFFDPKVLQLPRRRRARLRDQGAALEVARDPRADREPQALDPRRRHGQRLRDDARDPAVGAAASASSSTASASSTRRAKNFQLDLFTPDDGHFEYSAVATNTGARRRARSGTSWPAAAVTRRRSAELKQHLAFDAIPTQPWQANALWQQLCVLTHNLVRSFQLRTRRCARDRAPGSAPSSSSSSSLQTLRFTLLHQPARIVRPGGRAELRFAVLPDHAATHRARAPTHPQTRRLTVRLRSHLSFALRAI